MFQRIRYPYDDEDELSEATGLLCVTPSMAQQQFKDECDINTIAQRFGITGELPVNARAPTYGDFTSVDDFQSALNAVRQAEEAFLQLPGLVRERFGQDPARFVDFCSDPRNLDEMRELGLAVPLPKGDKAKAVREAVTAAQDAT